MVYIYKHFSPLQRQSKMCKILKNTKRAVQTRERMRIFRGIQSILRDHSASLNIVEFRQKLTHMNTSHDEQAQSHSLNNRLSDLSSNLKNWAIGRNIKKRAVTELLQILHAAGIRNLPKDSRSLLETARVVEIVKTAGGKYWHNGLRNCLADTFSNLPYNLRIAININMDGLPLFKSSPIAFWPILMSIHGGYTFR